MRRLLPFCLVVLVGCNAKDASDLTHDVGQVAKTATRAAGNAQLVIRINGELAQRKGVDVSGLHIENTGGVVTVGGHVRTAHEKNLVIQTVEGIRGVDKVVNQLRVEPKG